MSSLPRALDDYAQERFNAALEHDAGMSHGVWMERQRIARALRIDAARAEGDVRTALLRAAERIEAGTYTGYRAGTTG